MRNYYRFSNLIIIPLVMFLLSCQDSYMTEELKENLLLANENRTELQKVLDHFSKYEKDSLKLKAAVFLISNMNGHYSKQNRETQQCYQQLDRVVKKNGTNNVSLNGITIDFNSSLDLKKADLESVSAKHLIQNINLAFVAWDNPWSRSYNFEMFCKYILPYRSLNEQLQFDSRKNLLSEFSWLRDSLGNDSTNIKLAVELINKSIARDFVFLSNNKFTIPMADVSTLIKYNFGVCEQRYVLVVAALRACGISAVIDETPLWARYPGGHQWTIYFSKNGDSHPFNGGELLDKEDKYYFPVTHNIPLGSGNGTKIYRLNYANNLQSLRIIGVEKEFITEYFENGKKEDVTMSYNMPATKVKYEYDTNRIKQENPVVYLCGFNYGLEYKALDWIFLEKGSNRVSFDNVGSGESTYIIAQFENERFFPISNPFQLVGDIVAEQFIPIDTINEITLTRKFPSSEKARNFARNMYGAKIQASNSKKFSQTVSLHVIEEDPDKYYFKEVSVPSLGEYRYYRYLSDTGDINVAEVQFFLGQKAYPLKANEIFSSIASNLDNPYNIYDNNIRTNYNAPKETWVGFDFGKPVNITKIKYLFRNSFNIIEVGHEYELFYFDYGWRSLGKRKAKSNFLIYRKVPDHALFLLKDYTGGREERIFFYRWTKQNWL